jgi:hypothetical protein
MTMIGVIDDRDVDRQMIVDGIGLGNKEGGWGIINTVPLPALDEYPAWISQNKICALILDELLDEKVNQGKAVDYQGHDLVDFIRERFRTLPIFVITAHSSDLILQERFKDVEEIIDRGEFARAYSKYVPRITRSAQQYLNIFREELNALAIYAQKVATGGTITDDEKKNAQAIQTKLGAAYSLNSVTDISSWLDEATSLVGKIEELRKEIENKTGTAK